MFDDPQKELKRLEEQLLAEEDGDWLDGELEAMHRLLGDDTQAQNMDETRVYRNFNNSNQVRNYANGYGTIQTAADGHPVDDEDPELAAYSDEVEVPEQEKGVKGFVILACLETLGILAIIVYWLIVLL